jgi:multidrug resistance efflux pump
MKSRTLMVWGAIGATSAIGLVLVLAWRSPIPQARTAPQQASAARVVAQAQIVPIDGVIEVRPLAEGKVLRVLVKAGDRVATRQLLAEIESDLPLATVRQRRADVRGAEQRLSLTREGLRPEEQAALTAAAEAARHEAELARDHAQRQHELVARGFVSEQSVIESDDNLAAAEARAREAQMRAQAAVAGGRQAEVLAAQEEMTSAGAALDQGQVVLSRTRILAPISGVVMTRNVNPGDIIGSNITSPTLFRIVDPARVEVRLEVEELLAPRLQIGLPVRFVLPSTQIIVGHGTVTRLAPQVEKRSIGADDARIRADSMILPAWSDFTAEPGTEALPVNYRLEAWIDVRDREPAPAASLSGSAEKSLSP